jgi:hypothetical protein
MNKTVYYLTHRDTGRRLKYYATLQGARIAQRNRLTHQGFGPTIRRELKDNCEYIIAITAQGTAQEGTWYIEEDVIDSADLLED